MMSDISIAQNFVSLLNPYDSKSHVSVLEVGNGPLNLLFYFFMSSVKGQGQLLSENYLLTDLILSSLQ